ncbi:MAG: Na+/H+ antiporter subunit G [Bacteroidetes bacterium 4572_112]|nr:MAG: Na+/H+ antiporter subunit G [Bacteroidetes bacterium 4572_112]
MEILEYIGYAFVLIGGIFLFLGSLGIYRMPDVYNRLQAGTKASTMGAMSTIMGVGLIQPEWFFKTLIIVIFIAIANPLSSHALGRGAYRASLTPFMKKKMDAYDKEFHQNKED